MHTRGVPLAPDVDLGRIAATTPGMVGADLANLVNEAALLAARRNHDAVAEADLTDALERIVLGGRAASDDDRRGSAANRIPRGRPRDGGHAHRRGWSRAQGLDHSSRDGARRDVRRAPRPTATTIASPRLSRRSRSSRRAFSRGGHLQRDGTGAESDVPQFTEIARQMVGRWGMTRRWARSQSCRAMGLARSCPPVATSLPTPKGSSTQRCAASSRSGTAGCRAARREPGQARLACRRSAPARNARSKRTRIRPRASPGPAGRDCRATTGPRRFDHRSSRSLYASRSRIPSGRRKGRDGVQTCPRMREPSSSSRPISSPTSAAFGPRRGARRDGLRNRFRAPRCAGAARAGGSRRGRSRAPPGLPLSAQPLDERCMFPRSNRIWVIAKCAPASILRRKRSSSEVEVVGGGVDRDPDVEGRRRVDRPPLVVLAAVQARHQVREPDRVDLVHAARARVVADFRRTPVPEARCGCRTRGRRAAGLEAHDRRVAGRQVGIVRRPRCARSRLRA